MASVDQSGAGGEAVQRPDVKPARQPSTEAMLRKALSRLLDAVGEYSDEHFFGDERGMEKAAKKVDAAMRVGRGLLTKKQRRIPRSSTNDSGSLR